MKLIFLVLITTYITILPQTKDSKGGMFEIYAQVVSEASYPDSVTFELFSVSKVWEKRRGSDETDILPLISSLNYAYSTDINHKAKRVHANKPAEHYGIYHTMSKAPPYQEDITFGNGRYKMYIEEYQSGQSFYFYLDYTTDNYTYGSNNDIWVKYDIDNNSAEVRWNSNPGTYTSVSQGNTYNIWTQKSKQRSTSKLELFLKLSDQNGHPYLSWNEYHNESSILHYNVYKKESGGTYSVLATTNNTYYVDNTETFYSSPNQKTYVNYKISAQLNVSQESLFGNEERVAVNEIQNIEKFSEENKNISDESYNLKLLTNYPNPFNPITSITYQLPKKGHVVLKIYNTLGKEVAELVNDTKEEGTYSVKFNGDNLPSGMYFYKIQTGASTGLSADKAGSATGEFVDVKKMLLLK